MKPINIFCNLSFFKGQIHASAKKCGIANGANFYTHLFSHYFLVALFTIIITASFFLSFSNWIFSSPHDDQRIVQLTFLCISAGYTLTKTVISGRLPFPDFNSPSLFLSVFFCLGLISSALAFSPLMGFYEISIFFLLLITSFYIAEEVSASPDKAIGCALKILGYGCLLYAYKLFIIYISVFLVGSQPHLDDFTPGFSNFRFFNHTQTVTLPLLTLLYLNEKQNRRRNLFWLLLLSLWWALLILIQGRGTFVGLVAGVAVVYVMKRSQALAFCKAILTSALIGIVIYIAFFVLLPVLSGYEPFGSITRLAGRTLDNPGSGRLELWQWALTLIAANPWLGIGPMHYAHYEGPNPTLGHPHNWVLQIGAEWGLPALLCLCTAIYFAFRNLLIQSSQISSTDYHNQNIASGFIVTGVAILIDGLVSGLVVMPLSQCLIMLYLSLAIGWAQSFETIKPTPTASSAFGRLVFSLLVLISTCIVVVILSNGIIKFRADQNNLIAGTPSKSIVLRYPRLWLEGRF